MKYEPIDALFLPAQPDAECGTMILPLAGLATTLKDLFKVSAALHQLLKLFGSWVMQNYPPVALNHAFGAIALPHTTHLASKPIRIGATIQLSSKVL